jgi:hypothetical protein
MALLALVSSAVVGCGGDGSEVRTANTGPCQVTAAPTGPVFDEQLTAATSATAGGQESFDWNQNGSTDDLSFNSSTSSVSVVLESGEVTVEGVRSDFGDELVLAELPGAPTLEYPTESGSPSQAAFEQDRAAPTPAVVADLTGDGLSDLAVVEQGDVTVIVGQPTVGPTSIEVDLTDIDPAVAHWTSGRAAAGMDMPLDQATLVAVGDVNGDGIGDLRVDSYLARSYVPPAFYYGKPCAA